MIEIRTTSPDETLALGRRLAPHLTTGDVLLLSGPLGTGKTCLASGIAEGLGVGVPLVSPSFLIARTYRDGFLPLVHADVYRLGSLAELDDLELTAEAADGVLLVEWGDAVASGLPQDHLVIRIVRQEAGVRTFRFEPKGTWCERDLGGIL